MEIRYNTEMPKKGKVGGRKKGEVRIAFETFLKSDNKNMLLKFEEEQEAISAYYVICACKKREKQKGLYEVYKRGKKVYVEKTEKFFEVAKQLKEKEQICTNT